MDLVPVVHVTAEPLGISPVDDVPNPIFRADPTTAYDLVVRRECLEGKSSQGRRSLGAERPAATPGCR